MGGETVEIIFANTVHPCNDLPGLSYTKECPSIPINFNNTDANPNGLLGKRFYQAK